ncbi:MAG: FAD-dependent thymidylate synthase [Dehalococcoidales bacterium]|jgi:thymidylate synthase (FAD)|nr:FAD-dependent thymidylate synthase [Dehalococcoidales bacterium]
MDRKKEIDSMRTMMGTMPTMNPERSDIIHTDLSHIKVRMVGYPDNPYRPIYEVASATWGSREGWGDRWKQATPEGRLIVVDAALSRNTLPSALEAINFTFAVEGCSRSSFDQIARHRAMAFGSVGMRDNNHLDAALLLPEDMGEYHEEVYHIFRQTKDLYEKMIKEGNHNWQNARAIMPMGVEWRFTMSGNYRAFQDFCSQRLSFHEQADTVAVAWLIRQRIKDMFPLLGAYMRPACDFSKKCLYAKSYSISECFGCLFKSCGRWPRTDEYEYATWNTSCTTPERLRAQLGVDIPNPDEWDEVVQRAKQSDRRWFQ